MATSGSLVDIENENYVLEKIPIEEVLQQLKCNREGLSSAEGEKRLKIFGPNKLENKKENKMLKFLCFMWNPLTWVMEATALMAVVLANGDGRPPEWQVCVGIICLLLFKSIISFLEEKNADDATAALMACLSPKTKVLRDGKWSEQKASILVPGDIVSIKIGDIIPCDARLLQGEDFKVDQSTLTGESLPITKGSGELVFAGSTCKQGEMVAVVIATGVYTFFDQTSHLVKNTNQVGNFKKVLMKIGNFCIGSIAVGILIEIIVMYPIQRRKYRDGINNLMVLLIGGIPIAMPIVTSMIKNIGFFRLDQEGAIITKRMTSIEDLASMDVLIIDKTVTLTLNQLSVDKNLIEVYVKGIEKDDVLLLAARASRTDHQDAIDTAIVGMLSDPKEILDLCDASADLRKRVNSVIEKNAECGLKSLAVARQIVLEKTKESSGGPWELVGVLPLSYPPRHDDAETIRRALELGVNVKMMTGDQLVITKETGLRLGMGTNIYPSTSLLGQYKDKSHKSIGSFHVDELIEEADGFASVLPEHKYEILKKLQERKHICGMTSNEVNDVPALKKADIGIAFSDAIEAARVASDIVLTDEPGLDVIINAVLTSRATFQQMKSYIIYVVSITIRVVFGFMLIALIWKFDMSPLMVLIIAIVPRETILAISKDRVKPSPTPESWNFKEIFATGIVLGGYMALVTVAFFWAAYTTDFFPRIFNVRDLRGNEHEMISALYLQVSIMSQALIFVTRSRSWSFVERPNSCLLWTFMVVQLSATIIAVFASWDVARIEGIGMGWAGVIWLYNIVFYFPLDILKFAIRYLLTGKAWHKLIDYKAETSQLWHSRRKNNDNDELLVKLC